MIQKLYKTMLLLFALIVVGTTSTWADTKTEGFETATAGSNYQSTVNLSTTDSDCGIGWTIYYGTVSTSSKITGNNSAALRLYTSNNYGYIKTTTAIDGLTNVSFNAKAAESNSAKIKVNISYSADGSNWTNIETDKSLTTSSVKYSVDIPEGGKYFQIAISSNSTKPSKSNAQLTIDDVIFTYSTGGGGSTTYSVIYDANGATSGDVPTDDNEYEEDDEVTVLGNSGSLAKTGYAFGGWNTQANGEGTNYDEDDTFEITANTTLYAKWTPYVVTAQSNNNSLGTVSISGFVITATPAAGCIYADPAYTVSSGTATVSQEDNTFTVTPSSDCTITINFEALPTYTVTFGDGGSVTQEYGGAEVTLPSRSETAGYAFAGWSETNVASETTTAPTIIPAGGYTPTANITLYPVYSKTEGGGGSVNKTASVTISDYASTNSWVNATQYTTVTLDENVTATADGGGNTGKYYTNGYEWRFYQNESATATISLSEGDLTSATFTYNIANTGVLKYNGSTVTSGTPVELSGTSAEFTIENSGSATNGQVKFTAISVDYTITGAGTTYYWSAPVAAAVERPEITVAQNPFLFSTTATITCETEGAAIKYSYDGETWNNYSEALTITETKTIYAKAVKDENESTVASVTATKNLATPTVAISGDLTVDLNGETDVDAGTLTAAVTYNEAAVVGAVVTWSSNNNDVATIDENTGAVTIKTRGNVTFTATYAGNSDYDESTDTKQITVIDSKAPGSAGKPYTVAQARAAIDASEGTSNVYATGIVSECVEYSETYHNYTYNISVDGKTTSDQLQVFRGKSYNGDNFTSADDIQVGDVVVVYGNLTKYNSTYEFGQNNQLVSLVRKVASPTFDPESGEVIAGSTVTISTTTSDANIYYTTNGDDPTTESTLYSDPITINADQTIKAIAVKDGMTNSDIASATYTIIVTPTIGVSPASVNASAAGADDTIALTYTNLTISDESDFAVQFYDGESNEISTPSWIEVEVAEDNDDYIVSYLIEENTSTEPRTAYFKVYAMDDETNLVYSNLVTVTQAGMVIDYATLPFEWDGGTSGEIAAVAGVTTYDLGDYAAGNAPYRIKMDGEGDYILVKTNAQPGKVYFDVKMIGGATTSKIKVQESTDGSSFTDVEEFTISGKQNDVRNFATTNSFNPASRYVKIIKSEHANGGNIGVGPITITGCESVTIASAGYTTFTTNDKVTLPDGVTAYIATAVNTSTIHLEEVKNVPADEPIILKADAGTYYLPIITTATDDISDNILLSSDGNATTDEDDIVYALANKTSGVGFYKVKAGVKVPEGKAYFTVPTPSTPGVREFYSFEEDDATAIENVNVNDNLNNGTIYNIAGQRLQKLQKGINIVNGKKVLF